MLAHLKRVHNLCRRVALYNNNTQFFAKEIKQKGGKKDDPKGAAAPAAPVIQEVPI